MAPPLIPDGRQENPFDTRGLHLRVNSEIKSGTKREAISRGGPCCQFIATAGSAVARQAADSGDARWKALRILATGEPCASV